MKSIFDQTPFGTLKLSLDEQQRMKSLAAEILRSVLIEYDHFGPPPAKRSFSKSRWKPVKTNENCTAYLDKAARYRTPSASTASHNHFQYELSNAAVGSDHEGSGHSDESNVTTSADDEGSDWKMPELVVSGTVPGSLEDVLYGMTTHDAADMMLRTAYVNDNWLDASVLNQIELPTADDPFHFLGVKWYIKGIPMQYQALVLPRDFVFLEASGMLTRPDGKRIGYFIRHPVDLSACPELTQHSVLRGRFVSYSIYTPLPGGQFTDIFVRGKAWPNGKMAQAIAISLTAASLLSSSNAVFCAQSKKLTWLLRSAKTAAARRHHHHHHSASPLLAEPARTCRVCLKKFGKLSSVLSCSICTERVCSRCRIARSLSFVNTRRKLARVDQVAGVFCKTCVAKANSSSALEIATQEVMSGRYGPVSVAVAVPQPVEAASNPNLTQNQNQKQQKQKPLPNIALAFATRIIADDFVDLNVVDDDDEQEDDPEDDEDEEVASGCEWVPAIPYATTVDDSHLVAHAHDQYKHQQQQQRQHQQLDRQELWRKMAELRQQAETVYQLTKKHSDQHLKGGQHSSSDANHSGSNSIDTIDSDVDDLD